jgi:hypothetical protein
MTNHWSRREDFDFLAPDVRGLSTQFLTEGW